MRFLSVESIDKHKDYLKTLNLRYSILKKSVGALNGKSFKEIYGMRLDRDIKREALELLYEIEMHNIYFSSFSPDKSYISSLKIREQYKNEANFLNSVYKAALKINHGFLLLFCDGKGICIAEGNMDKLLFGFGKPMLALDMCEHCYYTDYGFNKKEYLLNAIPALKLNIFDTEK